MATSAASAKKWLEDKQPANEEVQSILDKLVARIESWTGEDDQIQGSIEAADILQDHLDNLSTPVSLDSSMAFDSGSLIPEGQAVVIDENEKRSRFEALKSRLNSI